MRVNGFTTRRFRVGSLSVVILLKLDAVKAPADVMVIDKAEKPSAN